MSHRFSWNQLLIIVPDRVVHPQPQRWATGAETRWISTNYSQNCIAKTPSVFFFFHLWYSIQMTAYRTGCMRHMYGRVEYTCMVERASCSLSTSGAGLGVEMKSITSVGSMEKEIWQFLLGGQGTCLYVRWIVYARKRKTMYNCTYERQYACIKYVYTQVCVCMWVHDPVWAVWVSAAWLCVYLIW